MKHDKLHSSAHIWLWNSHPELRLLFHTNFGDIKSIEALIRRLTGGKIGSIRHIILSTLKGLGLVKGTFDHELLYQGQLYYFDAKIPPDMLSKEQKEFKKINEAHGAKCFTYTNLEGFQAIINDIL